MPINTLDPIVNFIKNHLDEGVPFNPLPSEANHRSFLVEAAKQRNLTVKTLSRDHIAFFDDHVAVGGMYKMVTTLVSHPVISATNSKLVTKRLLVEAEVPVPTGRSFSQDHFDEAYEYFQHRKVPLVLKPDNGRSGMGITTNIQTSEQFREGWSKAVEASNSKNKIILEEHLNGLDIRAFVVADRVVAAATRLPAFVRGNGRDTLEKLVEEKTAHRKQNAFLLKMPLRVDRHWLAQQQLTTSSVPEDGAVVLLNGTGAIHQGGEPVDITDILSPELQQIAVQAAQAIPGLTVAGIDLRVESPTDTQDAVVLGVNTSASVSVHHIPAYGESRDVAGAIIDEMLRTAPRPPVKDKEPGKGRRAQLEQRAQRLGSRISRSVKRSPRSTS